MTLLLITLAIILLALGAIGTIYPALPSLPLMFAGAWLMGYAQDYEVIGTTTLLVLFIVSAFGLAMDFVAGMLGAKYTGASKEALWGAFIGGVVGAFFVPAGLILGPLLGAAIGEFADKRNLWLAGKVGIGALAGFIVGTVAKVGAALGIVLIILAQYIVYWLA
ncbi:MULTISPECIES: DUF456 domain-containing protein [Kingella]|jgi:hypothetical protein|uniref:DUF456 family protein n=1 Tax=Kingella bonacorsii TaxID=2796361 RepID=A0ABS1BQ98_9NEIS|nr:DUF456 family protein [Kingella bonacorsii]MBK0395449.1 DUF456 family protein [Kingella bonacorsii]